MYKYTVETTTPFIIEDEKENKNNDYFEKKLKEGLKNLLLLKYIKAQKSDFNAFIKQTLDFFLFQPNAFLEKENSLNFYIKCALELEKKELAEKFQYIDNLKMKISFPKDKKFFENIILINKYNTKKLIALKSNISFLCEINSYINFEKYNKFVKNIWNNEEKIFNKKYNFFLLNRVNNLCTQCFPKNFNNTNFVITNEIYSFLYNLNYNNYKKLNNLLLNNNIPTVGKTLNLGIQKNGKITPVNFFEIKYYID